MLTPEQTRRADPPASAASLTFLRRQPSLADYHHGVRVLVINQGACSIPTVFMALIGRVCTGTDVTVLLHNTPVLLTNAQGAVGKPGTKRTLAVSLQAIAV